MCIDVFLLVKMLVCVLTYFSMSRCWKATFLRTNCYGFESAEAKRRR